MTAQSSRVAGAGVEPPLPDRRRAGTSGRGGKRERRAGQQTCPLRTSSRTTAPRAPTPASPGIAAVVRASRLLTHRNARATLGLRRASLSLIDPKRHSGRLRWGTPCGTPQPLSRHIGAARRRVCRKPGSVRYAGDGGLTGILPDVSELKSGYGRVSTDARTSPPNATPCRRSALTPSDSTVTTA